MLSYSKVNNFTNIQNSDEKEDYIDAGGLWTRGSLKI